MPHYYERKGTGPERNEQAAGISDGPVDIEQLLDHTEVCHAIDPRSHSIGCHHLRSPLYTWPKFVTLNCRSRRFHSPGDTHRTTRWRGARDRNDRRAQCAKPCPFPRWEDVILYTLFAWLRCHAWSRWRSAR